MFQSKFPLTLRTIKHYLLFIPHPQPFHTSHIHQPFFSSHIHQPFLSSHIHQPYLSSHIHQPFLSSHIHQPFPSSHIHQLFLSSHTQQPFLSSHIHHHDILAVSADLMFQILHGHHMLHPVCLVYLGSCCLLCVRWVSLLFIVLSIVLDTVQCFTKGFRLNALHKSAISLARAELENKTHWHACMHAPVHTCTHVCMRAHTHTHI